MTSQALTSINSETQIVYLDFDGEITQYNNVDLGLDIDVTVHDSLLDTSCVAAIAAKLNEQYATSGVVFVTERPADGEYSTVYVGKNNLGYTGLAETIDSGNQNKSDEAFVNLDATSSVEQIVSVISHEVDHIVFGLNHGGEGLNAYRSTFSGTVKKDESYYLWAGDIAINATIIGRISSGYYLGGATLSSCSIYGSAEFSHESDIVTGNHVYSGGILQLESYGKASFTSLHTGGRIQFAANAFTQVGSATASIESVINSTVSGTVSDLDFVGKVYVANGQISKAVANKTSSGTGYLYLQANATANATKVKGAFYVSSSGVAHDTTVDWGYMKVENGGKAYGITVLGGTLNSGGKLEIAGDGYAQNVTAKGGTINVNYNNPILPSGVYDYSKYIYGAIRDVTLTNGATLTVNTGCSISGSLHVDSTSSVKIYGKMIFNFDDIVQSETVTINDFSRISFYNSASMELKLSDKISYGMYKLADHVSAFSRTIKVSDGDATYSLSLNQQVVLDKNRYSIKLENGSLMLYVKLLNEVNTSMQPDAKVNGYSVTISWNAVPPEESPLLYKVKIGNSVYTSYTNSLTLTEAPVGTHSYQVGVRDTEGFESWSSAASFTVTDVTAPTLSDSITLSQRKDSVRISWSAASDNVAVSGYKLEMNGTVYNTKNLFYSFNNLELGTYEYRICAYDAAGLETWSEKQNFTVTEVSDTQDHMLEYTMPTANCSIDSVTACIGMLMGYYDLYGYCNYDVSKLIDGEISVASRGDNTALLNKFIASDEYAMRFLGKTPDAEWEYTFVAETSDLNTASWNSLADYLGSGQYWRGCDDYKSSFYYASLAWLEKSSQTYSVSDKELPAKYADFKYGLDRYVESIGYDLNSELTQTVLVDNQPGGTFAFKDLIAEIDAGRGVLVLLTNADNHGFMVLAYGYNESTGEFIFDDTTNADCRMAWNGSYSYEGQSYTTQSVTTIQFDDTSLHLIDKTPPSITNVAASSTIPTHENVTVSATFSDNVALASQLYKVGNGVWHTYIDGVTVTENTTVYFKAVDVAGNETTAEYVVDNIDKTAPATPVATIDMIGEHHTRALISVQYSADSTLRQYSHDGKTWRTYDEKGIVVSKNSSLYFRAVDAAGNVSNILTCTINNLLESYTEQDVISTIDIPAQGELGLEGNYWDVFGLQMDDAGLFRIKGDFGNLNGSISILNGKKSVATGTIKNGNLVFNKGKAALLDGNAVYTILIKNSDKGKTASAYDFVVTADKLFDRGDNSDDWTDMKTAGAAGDVADLGKVTSAQTLVADGWVGYGDAVDYMAITLDTAASLSFVVNADDMTKFTIFQLNEKSGKYSLKSLQATTLKAAKGTTNYTATTKNLLLTAGTYYISMQSTNAKKGGDADYQISVNPDSTFFPAGDNTNDTWKAVTDRDVLAVDDHVAGWVGFGDAADFFKFEITESGALSLDFDDETARAVASKELKLTCLDAKGKSVALKVFDFDTYTSKKELVAGVYYLGVSCSNVKKFDTAYEITLGMLA